MTDHAERDVPRTGATRPVEHGSTAPTRPVPVDGRTRRTRPIPAGTRGAAEGAAGAAGAAGRRAAARPRRGWRPRRPGPARRPGGAAPADAHEGRRGVRASRACWSCTSSRPSADTLIYTALASTIFFAVPTEAARGRVATSLLVTMVPFVVLAPLIGPLLDRVPHGRRYALAGTMVVRAWLAWVMASAVAGRGDRTPRSASTRRRSASSSARRRTS